MAIPENVLQALAKKAREASRTPLKRAVQVHPDYLSELIIFYCANSEEPSFSIEQAVARGKSHLFPAPVKESISDSDKLKEVGLPNADQLDLAVRSDTKPVAELAQFYIDSHWYLQHPDNKMQKSPEEVMNFLQDLAREKFMWSDLNPSMRSYLSLVSQAYRHTRNRQIAILGKMRSEGKSIDEICDALRKYLRTDDNDEELGF